MDRLSFFFHNPNHAAALACALVPLCWGWRRWAWVGRLAVFALFVAVLLTQSRTGLLVLALEVAALSWIVRRDRAAVGCRKPVVAAVAFAGAVAVALWWLWPRLTLDGSVLNRPRIWLAGLRLFAANPDGVGLGNSGAVASAFLLDGIPEVRTTVSAHVTLLAEFGGLVGFAWFAFIAFAVCGTRFSPRVGVAFVGLVLSGCASTVFDWAVLFDFAEHDGRSAANWCLSWTMLLLFLVLGVRLWTLRLRRPHLVRATLVSLAFASLCVFVPLALPTDGVPKVRDGLVLSGNAPRTLALYDPSWSLKTVRTRIDGSAALPVRGVTRFPKDVDFADIDRVVLFGDCCEWRHLLKGVRVECVGE